MRRREQGDVLRYLALITGLLSAAGLSCGGGGSDLTVFAAVSLRQPLEEIARAFEAEHPDVDVVFNFAGSQRLRFQLEQGAEADVFVSADERQMEQAIDSRLVAGEPVAFAGNRLAVAVAEGNPASVAGLEDLASPGVRLVWADPSVPLGAYSRQMVAALAAEQGSDLAGRIEANVVSEEENAEAVVGKVELGEADAGIVYETDARRLERAGAAVLPIPEAYQPAIRYLAAALGQSDRPALARDFVQFLLSTTAQGIFQNCGFLGVR